MTQDFDFTTNELEQINKIELEYFNNQFTDDDLKKIEQIEKAYMTETITLQTIIDEIQNQLRTETEYNYNDLINDIFNDQMIHFEHQIGGVLNYNQFSNLPTDQMEFIVSTPNDENQINLNLLNNNEQMDSAQLHQNTNNINNQMEFQEQKNNNNDQKEESNQLEFEITNDQFSFSPNNQSINQFGGGIAQEMEQINFEFTQTDCKEYLNTKFKIKETIYNIKIKELEGLTFPEALVKMENLFQYIHSNFVQSLKKDQKIRLIINHSLFDYAISIHCMNRDEMTLDIIKNRFSSQGQSYKNVEDSMIKNNHQMTINVLVFDTITGGSNEFNDFLRETASIKV
jgi:hypothetical protein